MIANLFSKTRPINYVFIAITLFFCYGLYQFTNISGQLTSSIVINKIIILVLIMFSFVLINFISLKNTLTKNDNYAILLFLTFILFTPSIFSNLQIVLANFFLLLALRRLISLKTLNNPKEKIFDASFWVFLAAVFHFWCIFYIILVFVSLVFHSGKDFKNWLIPVIAFLCVTILYIAVSLLFFNGAQLNLEETIKTSFIIPAFKNDYERMALSVLVTVSALFFASQVLDYSNKPLNMQSTYKQIYFSFIFAVGIYVLSSTKNNALLLFSFAPMAILGSNLFEKLEDNWYKEVSVYLLFGLGLLFFILQL